MVFSDSPDKSQASFHPFNSSPGSFTGVSLFEKFGDQGFQFGAKTRTYRGIEIAIFFQRIAHPMLLEGSGKYSVMEV